VCIIQVLLDKAQGDLRGELDRAFRAEGVDCGGLSFRKALEQCEGAFQQSRYPFEQGSNLSKCPVGLLMACSCFLQRFVAKLQTRNAIQC
jgi:hypothetical protein